MLTAEQVRGMEAGAEMDAAVATLVMGWKLENQDDVIGARDDRGKYRIFGPEYMMEFNNAWSPSTRIECAWQVVEKIRDSGRKVTLETCHTGVTLHCDCTISGTVQNLSDWHEAEAETMPLATCRAALLSAGVANPPAHQ